MVTYELNDASLCDAMKKKHKMQQILWDVKIQRLTKTNVHKPGCYQTYTETK